jgi:hypothetical protein
MIMKADKVNSWLSLGANIGVVFGLMLVAYQINQEAELTRAQLFSDSTDSRREWNQAMMGSAPMEVVAKSIERPQELTLAELHMMDMYFVAAINELRRLEVLKRAGLNVDARIEGLEVFYFGSNFAKAWYEEYGGDQELQAIQDRINAVEPDWVVTFFDNVLARVDDNTGQSLSRDNERQQ